MTIRAYGPWVLVRADPPVTRTESGLYLPDGNLPERLGHSTGTVESSGKLADEVHAGDRVVFRGYLKNANRPHQLDRELSLIHINDIVGTLE